MRRPAVYVIKSPTSRRVAPAVTILYPMTFVVVIAMSIIFCGVSFSGEGDADKMPEGEAQDDSEDISEYVIGPEDVIQLSVWQYDQFNSTGAVGPDGKITVHLLGDILVAGLTREEVKEDISKRLSKFIKEGAEVTVSIVQFNSQKIFVIGQVRTPGTISFFSPPSLLEVMVQFVPTPDADLTAVKIIPADSSIRKPITVNMKEVLDKGDTRNLPKLHPGDTVYVPKALAVEAEGAGEGAAVREVGMEGIDEGPPGLETREGEFVVHVMGAVARPGSFTLTGEPTLNQALLRAGGVTDSTALKYIRVIRGGLAEEPAGMPALQGDRVIHVDLDKYLAEGDASLLPRLYSGDTIYVPDITQERMKEVSIVITGEVLNPGSYKTREPLDILDAISMAGGLTPNADPERIRVRRESAGSYEEKIVNINEFLKDVGSASPPEMVGPGYRIYVPTGHRPVSIVAAAVRGVVVFLADLIVVYRFSRWIAE